MCKEYMEHFREYLKTVHLAGLNFLQHSILDIYKLMRLLEGTDHTTDESMNEEQ